MQMSLYLNKTLAKVIDQESKKNKISRSKTVAAILEKSLLGKKQKSHFEDVFGILTNQQAQELLNTIACNQKNSSRFE